MIPECDQLLELIKWVISIGAPIVAGLAGVYLGAWLSGKHAKQSRKHSYIEKQLSNFYSPLIGLHKEVETNIIDIHKSRTRNTLTPVMFHV